MPIEPDMSPCIASISECVASDLHYLGVRTIVRKRNQSSVYGFISDSNHSMAGCIG